MENTFIALEKYSHTQWLVFFEGKLKGPVKIEDLALLIQQGKISIAAYAKELKDGSWNRMYDREEFQILLPSFPTQEICDEAGKLFDKVQEKNSPPPLEAGHFRESERVWYVAIQGAQYGPFSEQDLNLMVKSGRVNASTHFWKKGMDSWALIDAVSELNLSIQETHSESVEKRVDIRKPCEVKVLFTDGKEVAWAIARDISVGGMQVLTNNVPKDIGVNLELNISLAPEIPTFACKGKITRILEDRRGFCFRFLNLSDEVKEHLRRYNP